MLNFFSTIDMRSAFNQIPMHAEYKHKTSIITPWGLYAFTAMPFGLKTSAQQWQRLMDVVTRGLQNHFCYVDDIIVYSKTEEEHIQHLRQLLSRLDAFGLKVNSNKCNFGKPAVKFLGFLVSEHGCAPLPDRVEAIQNLPIPTTAKQLRSFIGTLQYYRRVMPNVAALLAPFHKLLQGKKKYSGIVFTDDAREAFTAAKLALVNSAMIAHPRDNAQTALVTDASSTAVGAVLQQCIEGVWRPLGYFSKMLTPAQRKYHATFDRELLGAFLAVQHFGYFLQGREFTLFVDHLPLVHAMQADTPRQNARQARHLALISEYTTDIQHIAGIKNIVADTLSRVQINAIFQHAQHIDWTRFAEAQKSDVAVQALAEGASSLKIELRNYNGVDILCDVSQPNSVRPICPAGFKKLAFDLIHNLSHPSPKLTLRQLSDRFVWKGMRKDCHLWAKSCLACQRSKITRYNRTPLQAFPPSSAKFTDVHIDITGPLKVSRGFRYILVVIDRFTRWFIASPLFDTKASSVIDCFMLNWIANYGVPSTVVSDRGSCFTSKEWTRLVSYLGCTHKLTCAYRPSCNGSVERVNRTLKVALKAQLASDNWVDILPIVLLGLRTVVRADLNSTACEMVYGTKLRLPGQFFDRTLAPESDTESFLRDQENYLNTFSYTLPRIPASS